MKANKNESKKAVDYKTSAGTKKAADYKAEAQQETRKVFAGALGPQNSATDRVWLGFRVHIARLIMNRFDQKAMEMMLHTQMGHPQEREPKVPSECLERATVRNERGEISLLPSAFKKSILSGCTGLQKTAKLNLRSKMYVTGHSIPITYESRINRVDMVRVGQWNNRVADVRFRPQFNNVHCTLVIRFPATIPLSMMEELINRGGEMGVGEWRPEKGGDFGTYVVEEMISDQEELARLVAQQESWIPPLIIPDWALDALVSPALAARLMSGETDDEDPKDARPATDDEIAEAVA